MKFPRSRRAVGLLAWLLCASCARLGCGEAPLAELVETQGAVERDFAGQVGSFQAAAVGATFHDGDGLRTGKAASAVVRIGARSRANVESDTTIRFLTKAQTPGSSAGGSAPSVAVESGSAVIEAGDEDLPILTSAGSAVLKRGSRVQLERVARAPSEHDGTTAPITRYRVLVGGATFIQSDGKSVSVGSGQSVSVGIGLAVLDPVEAPRQPSGGPAGSDSKTDSPSAATDEATEAKLPDAATAEGIDAAPGAAAAVGGTGSVAQEADVYVAPGETFRVYDPKPPTTIGFRVESRCSHGAELTVGKQAPVRGTREVRASLSPGTHAYSIRCLSTGGVTEKVAGRGFARVLRGDGARPLPKTAPRNSVDLDGRRYTLMYQNLRPVIAVGWPDAPKAGAYTFTLRTPDGRSTTASTREPRHTVASDALLDGTHRLSMATVGKTRIASKETSVDIVFDNAAPTASIESPGAQGFAPGGPVRVAGVALEGSRISVGGRAIELDKAHRFSDQIQTDQAAPSLAIRFQHPAYGVRYYLRRALRGAR